MNKRTGIFAILIGLVIMVAILCFSIFGIDRPSENQIVDLYFLNEDRTGIVAEQKEIFYRDEGDLIEKTLEALRRGPSSSKMYAVMPKSTDILGIGFTSEGSLEVNFTDKFLTDDPSRNVLNVYAVVKTLCSTSGVSSARVLVEGSSIKDRDGNSLEYILADDINLETEEFESEMRDVTLYFANKEKDGLVGEVRTIKITDQQPIEQYIIKELIKGPNNKELEAVLSKDTVLFSVDVLDDVCYLNFKSNFISENSGKREHEELVIYSIVNSLTELYNISHVQFYIDGRRVENFGELNIKDYISRDTSIIKGEGTE